MSDVADRLANLTPRQREALLRKLEARRGGDGEAEPAASGYRLPSLEPRPGERFEPFPLSDAQRSFLVARSGLFDLGGCGANAYFELHFPGAGDDLGTALTAAWRRLLGRHDMLRAEVSADGVQRVRPEVPPSELPLADLRGCSRNEAEAALAASRRRLQYADLMQEPWPLHRLRAFRLGDGVRLQVLFDLLIIDGEKRLLLFRELFRLLADPGAELPPVDCTYRDFVLTWKELEDSPLYRRAEEHWRGRLDELLPAPRLPLTSPLGPLTRVRFSVRPTEVLDRAAWGRLKARAGEHGLTPPLLALAAFSQVLSTWCEEPSFTLPVGAFFHPPLHPHLERVVGDFNTQLLVSVDNAAGGFAERARRLQDQLAIALDYQLYPGYRVARDLLRSSGGTSRAPFPYLFNSLLEFEHPRYGEVWSFRRRPDEAVEHRYVDAGGYLPQLVLSATVASFSGELHCKWQAVEGMLPDGLVPALAAAFRRLTARLADDGTAWEASWRELAAWLAVEEGGAPRHRVAAATGGDGYLHAAEPALEAVVAACGLTAADRILASAPPETDAGRLQALLAHSAAATLVPPPASANATVWVAPPAAAESLLLETEGADDPPPVATVILLDGRVPARLPERLADRFPGVRTFALAAPPQVAGGLALRRLDPVVEAARPVADGQPLGTLLPGRAVGVFNRAGGPCPADVPGELHVSGPPPATGAPGAGGMVPTGLLAVRRPGGEVEVLGPPAEARAEVLGYRLSLRRVAATLERVALNEGEVRHAVVDLAAAPGGRRLPVAWMVVGGAGDVDTGELTRRLATELPYYAVPAALECVETLPMDRGGRLDKHSLPPLAPAPAPPPGDDETARSVARLWEQVLGRAPVGPAADFFAAGGDSLALVRLQDRLRRDMGVETPLVHMFTEPTFARLVALVAAGERSETTIEV